MLSQRFMMYRSIFYEENKTPRVPGAVRPPVLTWQIAREGVGGVCKEDPPEPGAGVDEAAPGMGGGHDVKMGSKFLSEKLGISA